MKNKKIIQAVLLGIILSSLLLSPGLLDLTLIPRFLGLAIGLSIALFYFIRTGPSIKLQLDVALISYIGYTLFCCLSIFWAHTKSEAVFESSKQVLSFFSFMLIVFCLKKEKDYFMEVLLKFSIVLFAISFLFAMYQLIEIKFWKKEMLYLITGINGHKNLYSSFMFLNFFFLLTAYRKLNAPWKNLSLICMILTILLLFFLRTKAVWMGAGVALLLYFFFYIWHSKNIFVTRKLNFTVLIVLAVLSVTIFFFFFLRPLIHSGISNMNSSSGPAVIQTHTFKQEEERLILWDKTYSMIGEKPIIGVGSGNWQIYFPNETLNGLWRAEELNYTFQRPHNDFLWILSELGIIGFSLFLIFILSICLLLIKTLGFIPENKTLTQEVISCLAFIAGYYTISFFDFPKERMEHNIWISLILGISYVHIKAHSSLKVFGTIQITKSAAYLAFIILILVTFTGLMRFKGEYFTRQVYDFRNSNNNVMLIEKAKYVHSYAYSIDPTSIPISWYVGNAHANLGNYSSAKEEFLKAYALCPYNRNVLNDLASSYVYTNDVLMAKKYFEEAARISPRFDEPKLNLASMYINAKDYKTASFWLKLLMHDSKRRSDYEKMIQLLDK